jgi:hypothetical protein
MVYVTGVDRLEVVEKGTPLTFHTHVKLEDPLLSSEEVLDKVIVVGKLLSQSRGGVMVKLATGFWEIL